MSNELGVVYLIDTSRNVVEPERQGSNGLSTKYCLTCCPTCHVRCGQKRVEWQQDKHKQWVEKRKCSKCGALYTVPLLPFEVKEAEAIFADPDFGNVGIECR